MRANNPLTWKAYKNGAMLQSSEPTNDGYIVNNYSGNKVYKKIYFNKEHIWVKTVYYNFKNPNMPALTEIKATSLENNLVMEKTTYSEDTSVTSYLYPKSEMPPEADYSALAFTNKGFLYFNTVPNKNLVSKTVFHDESVDNLGGFNFGEVDFNLNRNMNSTFDITTAEYLTKDNSTPYKEEKSSTLQETDTAEFTEETIEDKVSFDTSEEMPDKTIESCGEEYAYFGDVDSDGKRCGYGRTATSKGKTAYEGEYSNDKRNGFGAFYYKNGDINYVGNWDNNVRNGFGIGFRSSDKTAHIGKWDNNIPDGIGARFDGDGNFLFLGNYVDGKKQGIGITLDENNNFIVSHFKDDEVISSRILDE
jgi:antitoxin component YwqK of YwqJK toxin-antitoxin module